MFTLKNTLIAAVLLTAGHQALAATTFTATPVLSSTILTTPTTTTPPKLVGDNMIADYEVARMLEQALPAYDDSIMAAKSFTDPVGRLSFDRVAELARDKPLSLRPAEGVTRMDDGVRTFSLDPKTGKVRFVNRDRAWNHTLDAGKLALDTTRTQSLAKELLTQLGLPAEELQTPLVRTQIAAGGKPGDKAVTERNEQYRLVIAQRQINRLPVFGANAKLAFNNRGELQRLGLEWPAFKLNTEKKLRTRAQVIEDAVARIIDQDADTSLTLKASLAYAPDGDTGYFQPVAVLNVNSLPTPYQLQIPLTASADLHD